jgi:diguanylate cyclase (GGDEF)-like protein
MEKAQALHPWSGEFLDPQLEGRFRLSLQKQTVRHVCTSLIVVAALFALFGLVDVMMVENARNMYLLLSLRMIVALASLVLFAALIRHPELVHNPLPLNFVLLLLVTSSILILPLRPETIQSQLTAAVAVTITLYLFIPNRISWVVALCVCFAGGFMVFADRWTPVLPTRVGLIGLVLLLPNIVGYLTLLRLNRLQREQFAALLDAQEANRLLQGQIVERQRLEQELRHLAQIDDLTGLNNRRWFLELAEQELRHARRLGTTLSICMLDLDHFKTINDNKGHAAGDRVLAIVADLCREELRDADIIGRFGGEEFIIALPNADALIALVIAERLRERIAAHKLPDELAGLSLTITAGIAEVAKGEESLAPALLRADQALYRGKHAGRNRVVVA